jgi:hypothetical protein
MNQDKIIEGAKVSEDMAIKGSLQDASIDIDGLIQ